MCALKYGLLKLNYTHLFHSRTLMISSKLCKGSSDNGNKAWKGFTGSVPENVEEVTNASVKARFSPHRTRDSSGARLDPKYSQPGAVFGSSAMGSQGSKSVTFLNEKSLPSDSHIGVYDAHNSVSLSSVMQSTVPHPYDIKGKNAPAHLNMPGGQWAQSDKYVSGDLQEHHSSNINKKGKEHETDFGNEDSIKLTQKQKLKRTLKDYGATVIVFHVTISLASLGFFYMLVSSGIDMTGLIEKLGVNLATLKEEQDATSLIDSTSSVFTVDSTLLGQSDSTSNVESSGRVQAVAAGVSTFVLAYAIHKVFAPLRIAITLTATPFIVRHLRRIGFLKTPNNMKT